MNQEMVDLQALAERFGLTILATGDSRFRTYIVVLGTNGQLVEIYSLQGKYFTNGLIPDVPLIPEADCFQIDI